MAGFFATALGASEVATPTLAKIIRVLAVTTGDSKVTCQDAELAAELVKVGIAVEDGARIVWALNDKDVQRWVKANRLVVCGQLSSLSQGAAIAVVLEGGRPAIYINAANAASARVAIPDAFLKFGKVVK